MHTVESNNSEIVFKTPVCCWVIPSQVLRFTLITLGDLQKTFTSLLPTFFEFFNVEFFVFLNSFLLQRPQFIDFYMIFIFKKPKTPANFRLWLFYHRLFATFFKIFRWSHVIWYVPLICIIHRPKALESSVCGPNGYYLSSSFRFILKHAKF